MRQFWLLVLLLVAACASPTRSFKKGEELEAEGRWAAAAEAYIDALRRDAEFPGAREKALETGNKAVQGFIARARELAGGGHDEQAVAEYQKADRLLGAAAGVGVTLKTPPGYAVDRRKTFERAVERALAVANDLAARGDWRGAVNAYRRAAGMPEPAPAQRERAWAGQFKALLVGTRAAMDAGEFDRAGTLVDQAVAVYGADSVKSAPARELRAQVHEGHYRALLVESRARMDEGRYQDAFALAEKAFDLSNGHAEAQKLRDLIIERGTVDVVATPVWRTDKVAKRVPAGLLDEVNDILGGEHWAQPPLFVATVSPDAVRREVRRMELDRQVLTQAQAIRVGETLKAEFAVVSYVVRCGVDRDVRPEKRTVTRRPNEPVEILFYDRRSLHVRCAYRLIDVNTRDIVAEGVVEADVAREHPHATYEGRVNELLLSPKEHRWFDRRELAATDREIEREVAGMIAARLAEAVYADITHHLP